MTWCGCCGTSLTSAGGCVLCDVTMSSPPHACLRWLEVIGDEDGCGPHWTPVEPDHETDWRPDIRDP